jgi:CRP/FNR family transcriptional regulator
LDSAPLDARPTVEELDMADDMAVPEDHGEQRSACRPLLLDDLRQGESDLRLAFRDVASHTAETGATLISPAQTSEALYVLRRGWACRARWLPDGRCTIADVYLPGDYIGLEATLRERPTETVLALQPVILQAIEASALPGLLERRPTAVYLAWLIGETQRRAERRADWIARFEARERLAAMLLDLHDRLRDRESISAGGFSMPLTQQQIGDHLGLTVVHVNRTLRRLREEGIVTVDNHVVMIHDFERLRLLANGELRDASGGGGTASTSVAARLST